MDPLERIASALERIADLLIEDRLTNEAELQRQQLQRQLEEEYRRRNQTDG